MLFSAEAIVNIIRQAIIDTYGWTISDGGGTYILSYFDGEKGDESTVYLNWELTADGTGYTFEIQRAYELPADDSGWFVIASIQGDSTVEYEYTDNYQLPDYEVYNIFYRMKITDTEGESLYSDTLTIMLTGIGDDINAIPTEFGLSQNYPNPFNPTTSIEYRVSSNENVSIKVYNMLGQEVMTLVNEVKSPGTYNVKMDGSQLASGVYIYRMAAGSFSSVKKFVLMK